jgi:Tfp pilus assembly protein PilF
MGSRRGWTWVAVVSLLSPLGCANWRFNEPGPIVSSYREVSEPSPRQAAQAALATAQALDAKGYSSAAINQYECARRHDPELKKVARRLAVLYEGQGDGKRAEVEYRDALREQPVDVGLICDLAAFHFHCGNWEKAEVWSRNALLSDPDCRRAWLNLGAVLIERGRAPEAQMAMRKARALDPELKQMKALAIAPSTAPALGTPRRLPLVVLTNCQSKSDDKAP